MFQRVLWIARVIDEGFAVENEVAQAGFRKALVPLGKDVSELPVLSGVLIVEGMEVVVVLGARDELLESFPAVVGKGKFLDEADLLLSADPRNEGRQSGRGKHDRVGESGCFVHELNSVVWTGCMVCLPRSRRVTTRKRTRFQHFSWNFSLRRTHAMPQSGKGHRCGSAGGGQRERLFVVYAPG